MNSTWKGVALTLVILLVAVFIYDLFSDSGPSESDKAANNRQYDLYHEYLEKQDQMNTEYFEKLNDELAYSREIANQSMKNQERYEQLLERWEKQADRMDAVLLKLDGLLPKSNFTY